MSLFLKCSLIAFSMMLMTAVIASTPIEQMVPVDHVYIPNGFDTNDSVEVIITGFLPNLCHKAPASQVVIKDREIKISVTSLYYEESNPFCPEMVVPFTQSVNLGIMDKGNYNITVNGKSPWETKEKIMIAESTTNAIDDFSYAYVTYVDKETEQKGVVTLKGYNPSDCFELDKIDYIHNGKDTYSIMPKMKQVNDFCPMKLVPFAYDWKVPSDLNNSKVLLHVRTMDGKSVNSVFFK